MAVAARVAFVKEQILGGRAARMLSSLNRNTGTEKVKVVIEKTTTESACRRVMSGALDALSAAMQTCIVAHMREHTSSDGLTLVEFFIKPVPPAAWPTEVSRSLMRADAPTFHPLQDSSHFDISMDNIQKFQSAKEKLAPVELAEAKVEAIGSGPAEETSQIDTRIICLVVKD